MLGRIVAVAAIAGVLSGLLLTGLQQFAISPLIRAAEVREAAAAKAHRAHGSAPDAHVDAGWSPKDGLERLGATALANIALAIGFALLLGAAMSARDQAGWRVGLLWGLAGFVVFFVAPSLGLPPELPGTEAPPLRDRTTWWIATASATAAGLWLAVFEKHWPLRIVGIVLVAAPHLFGAPLSPSQPEADQARAAVDFVASSAIVNAAFWIALGGFAGLAGRMFAVDPGASTRA